MVVGGTLGRGSGAGYPRQQSRKADGALGDCVAAFVTLFILVTCIKHKIKQ